MSTILRNQDIPRYYELRFNPDTMEIVFQLHPIADKFVLNFLHFKRRFIRYLLPSEYQISLFAEVEEAEKKLGPFYRQEPKTSSKEFITWRCPLNHKEQYSFIVGSIGELSNILSLFAYEGLPHDKNQLMLIENLSISHERTIGACVVMVGYSRQMMSFCETIWENKELHELILSAMIKTYLHITQSTLSNVLRQSFKITRGRGENRFAVLNCPGDRTCLMPSYTNSTGGEYFFSNNCDGIPQQLSLLVGAIVLSSNVEKI